MKNIHSELNNIFVNNSSKQLIQFYEKYSEKFPKKLFRYMDIESYTDSNLSMLLDNKLSLSDFKSFNDPLDTDILKIVHDQLNTNQRYSYNKYDGGRDVLNSILVRCLSSNNPDEKDSMLMWAYYAKSHKGICIEYDTKELVEFVIKQHQKFNTLGYEMPLCYLLPISYLPKIFLADYKEKMINGTWPTSLFEKRECWIHENEWRIFYGNPDLLKAEKYEDKFITIEPKKIYLGCQINPEFELKIRERFESKSDGFFTNINKGIFFDF